MFWWKLDIPSWREMSESPPVREAHPEPNGPKFGWQHRANMSLEEQRFASHWADVTTCQSIVVVTEEFVGSVALTALPTSRTTRIEPHRIWLSPSSPTLSSHVPQLPMWPDLTSLAIIEQLASGWVLGKRGFPLECAAAQVCREAGGRVSTNVFVRDLDLAAFNALDNRRVEVIADGLPLWYGAQLAIDTTLVVSPLRGDGSARGRAADHSGSAFFRKPDERKERTYLALVGEAGRACLVVLAAEVGGKWSEETAQVGWPRLVRILCHPSSKAE